MNVVILPKESRVVSEEEDDNDDNMTEGEERYDEGVWMDGRTSHLMTSGTKDKVRKIVVLPMSMQKTVLKR